MKVILYISRNGLAEPLGRSQILPYLFELSKKHKIIIISNEKESDLKNHGNIIKIKHELNQKKIIWQYSIFRYGKKAVPYGLIKDLIIGIYFCLKYKVEIIHCRGYLTNSIGLIIKFFFKNIKLVFDMRALWPEEVALGLKGGRRNLIYKMLKLLEKVSIKKSDAIISLTDNAKDYLIKIYQFNPKKIYTIPTCVDLKRFQYINPSNIHKKKFSCIGTIISDWFLLDWLKTFFQCVQEYDGNAIFEIISNDRKETLLSKLNFDYSISSKLIIRSASYEEMPNLISSHSASAMFFKPDISKLGSSPTRLGEILAVGRPIICNSGVGDLNAIINPNKVGIVVDDPKHNIMISAVEKLYVLINDPATSAKCRQLAEEYYSIYSGSQKYSQIYSK